MSVEFAVRAIEVLECFGVVQRDADDPVTPTTDRVGIRCRQRVAPAAPGHGQVRCIGAVPATGTLRMHVTPAAVRPLPTSGVGRPFERTPGAAA